MAIMTVFRHNEFRIACYSAINEFIIVGILLYQIKFEIGRNELCVRIVYNHINSKFRELMISHPLYHLSILFKDFICYAHGIAPVQKRTP